MTEQAEQRAGKLLCDEDICLQVTEKRGVCTAESTITMTSAVTEERIRVLRLSNLPTLAGPIMPLPAVRVSPLLQKPHAKEPECSTALVINVERLLFQADVSYLWVFFVRSAVKNFQLSKLSTLQIEFFEAIHSSFARNHLPPSRVQQTAWPI